MYLVVSAINGKTGPNSRFLVETEQFSEIWGLLNIVFGFALLWEWDAYPAFAPVPAMTRKGCPHSVLVLMIPARWLGRIHVSGQLDHSVPAMAAHLLETIVRTVNLGARKREKPQDKRKKGKTAQKMECYSPTAKPQCSLVLKKKALPVAPAWN